MKRYLPILILLYCQSLFAFFCPNNFNTINIGDDIEKVKVLCGNPDSEAKSSSKPDEDAGTQEWIYDLKPDPSVENGMRVNIIFQDKKALSITVNGAGLSTTSLCDQPINVGDNMDTVKQSCGKPIMVNKNSTDQKPKTSEIVVLKYINNTPTPATLIFEDGKLKERK